MISTPIVETCSAAPLHACLYIHNASMPYMTCLGCNLSSSLPDGSMIFGDAIFGQTDRPVKYSGMVSSPILAITCLSKGFTTSKWDAHALPSGTAYEHLTCIQLVHQQQVPTRMLLRQATVNIPRDWQPFHIVDFSSYDMGPNMNW